MISVHAQAPPPPESWPRISINGKTSGPITRADVQNASRIAVQRSNGSIDSSLRVVSFHLSLWSRDKNAHSDSVVPMGDSLTQSLKRMILSQPKGSIVYIEYVQTQMTTGAFRKLPPGKFELTD